MSKLAWVFPGQGAQVVGMGKALCLEFSEAREVFDTAARVLGSGFVRIVFEGPEAELVLTRNAQPALLAAGVACARVARSRGLHPDMLAGLSLGEYTALVVAGSLGLEDALKLTRNRGIYMQEACPPGKGAMAAVLGLSCAEIDSICFEARKVGVVSGSNYNCPGQTVISGEKTAVRRVMAEASRRGGKCIPLSVSAPFHCELMKPAALRLAEDLEKIQVNKPVVPVYSNVEGTVVESVREVRDALTKQVTHPVLWQVCVEAMVGDGAGAFVEMGPGRSLTGFLKRIAPGVPGITFHCPEDLDPLAELSKEILPK